MCLRINAQLIRDFTISFFGGLTASLVVVFALNQGGSLNTGVFYVYLMVLYVVGLLITGFINQFTDSRKTSNNKRMKND